MSKLAALCGRRLGNALGRRRARARAAARERGRAQLEAAGADAELAAAYLRTRAFSLRFCGASREAQALLERATGWNRGAGSTAIRKSLLAWLLIYDGQLGQAVAELEAASRDPALDPATRLDLLVALVAALGRAEAECRARPEVIAFALELRVAQAWVAAADGWLASARDELLAIADEAGEYFAVQMEAAHDALRIGAHARACAKRLAPLAERTDVDLGAARAAHAAASTRATVARSSKRPADVV